MHANWQPRFKIGDRVLILASNVRGRVVDVHPDESAYEVEINGNPEFRLLCTKDDLGPSPADLDPEPSMTGEEVSPVTESRHPGRQILLVEDEAELCMILGDRLRKEGYRVEVANDGPAALEKARSQTFDVIILDAMLPTGTGYDVCIEMRKSGIGAPVLFLTALGRTIDKVIAFKAGADDHLTKPFDTSELLARVDALIRRSELGLSRHRRGEPRRYGTLSLDVSRRSATLNGQRLDLKPREFHLLHFLAENSNRAVSREELLEHVWGKRADNITRTVDIHIVSLRQKIEPDPKNPTRIVTVPGIGYCFRPEGD